MKNLRILSVLVLVMAGGLTGCLSTTRRILKEQPPAIYQTATVEQVVRQVTERDAAIKTLKAEVEITAATGGSKEGKVTEYTSFTGYIFVQKPADLRVILQLPLIGSRALDMVSTGKEFTLMHASSHGNVWMQGTDKVAQPSANGLQNLRPAVFLDSLLVPGLQPDEYVTMASSTRVLHKNSRRKTETVEPDYDLTVLKIGGEHILRIARVVHISRVTMLPYQQDIYDAKGEIVTQATYDSYRTYAGQLFPAVITIRRPLDEYSLRIAMMKLTLNEPFDADQFQLTIPPGITVKRLK